MYHRRCLLLSFLVAFTLTGAHAQTLANGLPAYYKEDTAGSHPDSAGNHAGTVAAATVSGSDPRAHATFSNVRSWSGGSVSLWLNATARRDAYGSVNAVFHTTKQSRLYLNGTLETAMSIPAWGQVSDKFYWGAGFKGHGVQGSIDETGIWNRPLTAEEATALYHGGTGAPYLFGGAPAQGAPSFTVAGVTNAASGQPGLVPGSLATIYGSGLTQGITGVVQAQTTPWPVQLSGTSVLVGDVAAPIYAIANVNGQEQINFQVPWEMAGRVGATVVVSNNGNMSAGLNIPVFAAQPAVFAGGVLHAQDYQPVTTTKPARPGEVLLVYATGIGSVDHQPLTGQPAPSVEPLSRSSRTMATLGPPATVLYAGLAAGYIGVYQINLQVPLNAPSGALSLVLTCAGYAGSVYQVPVLQSSGAAYVENFQATHPRWQANDPGGPNGITRADNVILPNTPARLGVCGISPTIVADLTIIIPSSDSCKAAYIPYQTKDKQWHSGAGGEIEAKDQISYGYYEITMKASQTPGAVNAFFMYLSDSNEIDIELLSKQHTPTPELYCSIESPCSYVNFTAHLLDTRQVTSLLALPFAPWAEYHRYGFDWQPDGITWYIDGQPATLGQATPVTINGQPYTLGGCPTTITRGAGRDAIEAPVDNPGCFSGSRNVPQPPGSLMVNHWSNGQGWSGPNPSSDALMSVRNIMLAPNIGPH